MGELSNFQDKYADFSRESYQKILELLKDNYCWRCPMRTTSEESRCREVDAWLRLSSALEEGICQYFNSQESILPPPVFLKYLNKINNRKNLTFDRRVLIKINCDMPPFAFKGNILLIDENVNKIKAEDLVLLPEICPIYAYGFSILKKVSSIPFKISKVTKTFSKYNVKYLQIESDLEIPLVYAWGRIIKIMSADADTEFF